MINQVDLNILVCNILNAKSYSNCRLCLKNIKNHYVRFDDMVCLESSNTECSSLSEILKTLLGEDSVDELPGVEALCTACVESAVQALRFIKACRQSTHILHQVVNNLSQTLTTRISSDGNQAIYITIDDLETDLIVVNKEHRKISRQDDEYLFECKKCGIYFDNYSKLNMHNLKLHVLYTCEQCFEVFDTDIELQDHTVSCHKFECAECLQSWDSIESLRSHQDRVHNIYVCKDCGKSYKGLDKLQMHEAKHSNKNTCPKCGKMYTTKEFYIRHVNLCLVDKIDPHPIRSNYKRDYICEICDKSYSTPGGLRVHERFAHENAKPHICNVCGKKFTAPSYLKTHMIKHTGEKNYKCNICNGKFVSKEALLYHTRRHTGEKPYSCKICNERFVNASSRAEHIKYRHVGPTLMCEICSRKFVTSLFLKQHISRHHDPSSKLYYGRNMIPPNMPGEGNMRVKIEIDK